MNLFSAFDQHTTWMYDEFNILTCLYYSVCLNSIGEFIMRVGSYLFLKLITAVCSFFLSFYLSEVLEHDIASIILLQVSI